MSTFSQPIFTIGHSQKSNDESEIYQFKYISQLRDDKTNATIDYQSNKLPVNLFHSAAEYHKMLISIGKSREKKSSHIIEGIITSLEYVNDHIFEKELGKKAKAKMMNFSLKTSKKQTQNCICCCCNEFCQQCTKKAIKRNKNSNVQIGNISNTIDYKIMLAKTHKSASQDDKENNKNTYFNIKNRTQKDRKSHSKRVYSSIDAKKFSKVSEISDKNKSINYEIRGVDISHLIIKSMLEFNQRKKVEELQKISNLNTKKAKEEYLSELNNRIRMQNLEYSKVSKSKQTQKSKSKHQMALKYWQKVRDQIIDSIKNDNYSKPLKKQLTNFNLNVYQHHEPLKKVVELKQQQIQKLREIHEQQAKIQIQLQAQEKLQKTMKIKKNLKSLQRQRIKRLNSCDKKPFRPTADMIQNAFKNLVEQVPEGKNLNGTDIFKNQRLKKKSQKGMKIIV